MIDAGKVERFWRNGIDMVRASEYEAMVAERDGLLRDWVSVKERLPQAQKAVLIAYEDQGKSWVTMGWYCPAKTLNADDFSDDVDGEYDDATDTFWLKEGWVDESRESEWHYSLSNVTHWMPLPSAPQPPAQQREVTE